MIFKNWLLRYTSLNTPLGDIIRDIVIDPNFPISDDFYDIEEYLDSKISTDNMDELRKLWEDYSKTP